MNHAVLLIGKPNSGKSLLFNRLTGLRQKVANFPGVTVEVRSGSAGGLELRDFPGIYSLYPVTRDEEIAVEKLKLALEERELSTILCMLDATRLERSLLLGLQVRELAAQSNKPVIFAVNMMDEIEINKASVKLDRLEELLQRPVLGISARTGKGLNELRSVLMQSAPLAVKVEVFGTKDALHTEARRIAKECGPDSDVLLKSQNKIDGIFLSGTFGYVAFALTMIFLFQSIFTWATPLMDGVENLIGWLAGMTMQVLPQGVAADFVHDALFGGIGSFLVFVPQIFVLTFIIGLLEDSGYLARAAIICHKPLSLFGLSGRSFVPLLSGHACAIPAMMAARTIESPKRRLLTIIAIPLMACSARLPVYSLLIVALIPSTTFLGGLFGWQGLAFFALYVFGMVVAMIVSGVLAGTLLKSESDAPFIIELPPYRIPVLKPLLYRSFQASKAFVKKAGLIIFVVTVVVWVLGYFPGGPEQLGSSWLAAGGRLIEPIFEPLGLDWKYGVAILASFLAREVFVGTLGTLFGIEGADENIAGLAENIQASGFTMASGIALLVFYAIALQCISTVAVIRQETGSNKLAMMLLVGYGLLAYCLAIIAYQVVQLIGFS